MGCSNGMHEDEDGTRTCDGECDSDAEDTFCAQCKRYAWKLTIDGFCSERCRNAALEQVYAEKEVA